MGKVSGYILVLLLPCILPDSGMSLPHHFNRLNAARNPKTELFQDPLHFSTYIEDEKVLKSQVYCVLFNGPCDAVGRWIKPRVKAGFLGDCLDCTSAEEGWLDIWLRKVVDTYPDLYRMAVTKFLKEYGLDFSTATSSDDNSYEVNPSLEDLEDHTEAEISESFLDQDLTDLKKHSHSKRDILSAANNNGSKSDEDSKEDSVEAAKSDKSSSSPDLPASPPSPVEVSKESAERNSNESVTEADDEAAEETTTIGMDHTLTPFLL